MRRHCPSALLLLCTDALVAVAMPSPWLCQISHLQVPAQMPPISQARLKHSIQGLLITLPFLPSFIFLHSPYPHYRSGAEGEFPMRPVKLK